MLLSMSGEKSDKSDKSSLLCGSLWILQNIAGIFCYSFNNVSLLPLSSESDTESQNTSDFS